MAAIACGTDTTASSNAAQSGDTSAGTGGANNGGGGIGQGAQGGNAQGGNAQGGNAQGGNAQGGAGQGGGGNVCTWSNTMNPCGNGEYCQAPGCGQGVCVPVTIVDDTAEIPVCGCDDVNYWNAVTASNHGMSVASQGGCPTPLSCGGFGGDSCPDSAHYCGYDVTLLGCNVADANGICWGMPLTCDIIGFGGQHRLCPKTTDPCVYECEAIKLQQNYYSPGAGEMCPQ